MKKIFALVMLAGTIAFVSCNNAPKTEGTENKDSAATAAPAPAPAPAVDSTKKDSAAKPADAAAPAGDKMEKKEEKKEEKKK